MKVEVPIVNAFTDENAGGNPAGVVLDAQQYAQDQKQRIAAAIKLSETAFVSPSSIADFKVEFFTPTRQIAHCGHATIATFSYLQQINALNNEQSSKETIDGRREILIKDDTVYMEQLAPRYTDLNQELLHRTLDSLGLTESNLLAKAQPSIVNTGNSFLVVALRNSETVKSANPNFKLISNISEDYDVNGFYIFSPEPMKKGRDAGARMFAPAFGINEESATGMAAGPLAGYLYDKLQVNKHEILIEQGHLMTPPSPSLIRVKLHIKEGAITSLMAGGRAAVSETKSVEI